MSNSPPVIELLGPWLQNNGDGLNLWSVAERFKESATVAVSSTLGLEKLPERPRLAWVKWMPDLASLGKAARSGSPQKVARVCQDGVALALAPRRMLHARRIAPGREIAALLDCSGFAYGDVWPTHRVERRAAYYRKLKAQGTAVILLPQAFGPFERPEMRHCCRELFEQCELIYPRDAISRQHLVELGVGDKAPAVTPDITHLLKGTPPVDPGAWKRRVCIVPNARMTDKTSPERGDRYFGFILKAIDHVRARDLEPVLLVHERNDLPLAQCIRDAVTVPPAIVDEDALASKGILGGCYAVVGSRYHALISALSQGVPAIGTSWSHKYEELFGDYGCCQYLLSPEGDAAQLEATLGRMLDPAVHDTLAAHLAVHAQQQKAKVEEMWSRIEWLIFSRH
ncbi:MAG TPA: polysaccharide pyruvyl transferase family protein [Tepidisphaeraceae bacterium]|nr:polysaccharide pyruvyl transferase family protein [Tepidisphaeraceae bacterium]